MISRLPLILSRTFISNFFSNFSWFYVLIKLRAVESINHWLSPYAPAVCAEQIKYLKNENKSQSLLLDWFFSLNVVDNVSVVGIGIGGNLLTCLVLGTHMASCSGEHTLDSVSFSRHTVQGSHGAVPLVLDQNPGEHSTHPHPSTADLAALSQEGSSPTPQASRLIVTPSSCYRIVIDTLSDFTHSLQYNILPWIYSNCTMLHAFSETRKHIHI